MDNPAPIPPVAPPRMRPNHPAMNFHAWSAIQAVVLVAVITATILTLFTPGNIFSNQIVSDMLASLQATQMAPQTQAAPTQALALGRVGIVAGHWGNDSGAVCADNLTEVSVNQAIAQLAAGMLEQYGYQVDLMQEYDPRLNLYEALALVSIHNDSCEYLGTDATGFKVASAPSTVYPEAAQRLTDCLSQRYREVTGLEFHANTVTDDMLYYHAFSEINSNTPAAIIETGFLNLDRALLTEHPDMVARGVVDGILCFVRNENINPTAPAP